MITITMDRGPTKHYHYMSAASVQDKSQAKDGVDKSEDDFSSTFQKEDVAKFLISILCKTEGRETLVNIVSKHYQPLVRSGIQTPEELVVFCNAFPRSFRLEECIPSSGSGALPTSNLTADRLAVSVTADVKICARHVRKAGACPEDGDCCCLHLCKFYLLSGKCTFARSGGYCQFGHKHRTDHNLGVLKRHLLDDLKVRELQTLMRRRCNRSLQTRPNLCRFYNNPGGCAKGSGCSALHLCRRFMLGGCKFGDKCMRNHDLTDPSIISTLYQYSIDVDELPDLMADHQRDLDALTRGPRNAPAASGASGKPSNRATWGTPAHSIALPDGGYWGTPASSSTDTDKGTWWGDSQSSLSVTVHRDSEGKKRGGEGKDPEPRQYSTLFSRRRGHITPRPHQQAVNAEEEEEDVGDHEESQREKDAGGSLNPFSYIHKQHGTAAGLDRAQSKVSVPWPVSQAVAGGSSSLHGAAGSQQQHPPSALATTDVGGKPSADTADADRALSVGAGTSEDVWCGRQKDPVFLPSANKRSSNNVDPVFLPPVTMGSERSMAAKRGEHRPVVSVLPLVQTKPQPSASAAAGCPPQSLVASGPIPQSLLGSGPIPQSVMASRPMPQSLMGSGPIPQSLMESGPIPQSLMASGPIPQSLMASRPVPQNLMASGSIPQSPMASRPVPQSLMTSRPMPQSLMASGPMPQSLAAGLRKAGSVDGSKGSSGVPQCSPPGTSAGSERRPGSTGLTEAGSAVGIGSSDSSPLASNLQSIISSLISNVQKLHSKTSLGPGPHPESHFVSYLSELAQPDKLKAELDTEEDQKPQQAGGAGRCLSDGEIVDSEEEDVADTGGKGPAPEAMLFDYNHQPTTEMLSRMLKSDDSSPGVNASGDVEVGRSSECEEGTGAARKESSAERPGSRSHSNKCCDCTGRKSKRRKRRHRNQQHKRGSDGPGYEAVDSPEEEGGMDLIDSSEDSLADFEPCGRHAGLVGASGSNSSQLDQGDALPPRPEGQERGSHTARERQERDFDRKREERCSPSKRDFDRKREERYSPSNPTDQRNPPPGRDPSRLKQGRSSRPHREPHPLRGDHQHPPGRDGGGGQRAASPDQVRVDRLRRTASPEDISRQLDWGREASPPLFDAGRDRVRGPSPSPVARRSSQSPGRLSHHRRGSSQSPRRLRRESPQRFGHESPRGFGAESPQRFGGGSPRGFGGESHQTFRHESPQRSSRDGVSSIPGPKRSSPNRNRSPFQFRRSEDCFPGEDDGRRPRRDEIRPHADSFLDADSQTGNRFSPHRMDNQSDLGPHRPSPNPRELISEEEHERMMAGERRGLLDTPQANPKRPFSNPRHSRSPVSQARYRGQEFGSREGSRGREFGSAGTRERSRGQGFGSRERGRDEEFGSARRCRGEDLGSGGLREGEQEEQERMMTGERRGLLDHPQANPRSPFSNPRHSRSPVPQARRRAREFGSAGSRERSRGQDFGSTGSRERNRDQEFESSRCRGGDSPRFPGQPRAEMGCHGASSASLQLQASIHNLLEEARQMGSRGPSPHVEFRGREGSRGPSPHVDFRGREGSRGPSPHIHFRGREGNRGPSPHVEFRGREGSRGPSPHIDFRGREGSRGPSPHVEFRGREGSRGPSPHIDFRGREGSYGPSPNREFRGREGSCGPSPNREFRGRGGSHGPSPHREFRVRDRSCDPSSDREFRGRGGSHGPSPHREFRGREESYGLSSHREVRGHGLSPNREFRGREGSRGPSPHRELRGREESRGPSPNREFRGHSASPNREFRGHGPSPNREFRGREGSHGPSPHRVIRGREGNLGLSPHREFRGQGGSHGPSPHREFRGHSPSPYREVRGQGVSQGSSPHKELPMQGNVLELDNHDEHFQSVLDEGQGSSPTVFSSRKRRADEPWLPWLNKRRSPISKNRHRNRRRSPSERDRQRSPSPRSRHKNPSGRDRHPSPLRGRRNSPGRHGRSQSGDSRKREGDQLRSPGSRRQRSSERERESGRGEEQLSRRDRKRQRRLGFDTSRLSGQGREDRPGVSRRDSSGGGVDRKGVGSGPAMLSPDDLRRKPGLRIHVVNKGAGGFEDALPDLAGGEEPYDQLPAQDSDVDRLYEGEGYADFGDGEEENLDVNSYQFGDEEENVDAEGQFFGGDVEVQYGNEQFDNLDDGVVAGFERRPYVDYDGGLEDGQLDDVLRGGGDGGGGLGWGSGDVGQQIEAERQRHRPPGVGGGGDGGGGLGWGSEDVGQLIQSERRRLRPRHRDLRSFLKKRQTLFQQRAKHVQVRVNQGRTRGKGSATWDHAGRRVDMGPNQ